MTHIRKRIRKLSTAVFRGSRSEYNFDVYPITTDITDHPVVFIFSRRKVDKKGRGHHAVSCVGETHSIVSEIRKHKRARCIKGNEANVVCILREADRPTRSGVLDDLSQVRAFSCIQGKFKPTVRAKLGVVANAKSAKILSFRPLSKTPGRSGAVVASAKAAKSKSESVEPTKIEANSKSTAKRKTTGSKTLEKGRSPEKRPRVQNSVDGDGGQRQLPSKKTSAARTAKTRIAAGSRALAKRAA